LTIMDKSNIKYYGTKASAHMYIKNIWDTMNAWGIIKIYCYENSVSISFSKTLESDLISWWEYLLQKDLIDNAILDSISLYLNTDTSNNLICIINKDRSLQEKNYNNNNTAINLYNDK
jgi:hypothetical protein